jgi:hypothetical protein
VPFVAYLHNRDRKRPVLIPNKQECTIPRLWIYRNTFLFACLGGEVEGPLPILRVFTSKNNVIAVRTENFDENVYVKLRGRIDQGIGSPLRSVEGFGSYID